MNARLNLIFLFLFILLFLGMLSMTIGASSVGPIDIFSYFTQKNLDPSVKYIIQDLRLPRTLALIAIGFSLALSGVLLQTVLDNPVAEPYTLGVSGGAALGAVLTLILSTQFGLPLGAFFGSLVVTVLIILIAQYSGSWKSNSLILVGVMLSLFCGSIVTILVSLLEPSKMQIVMYWMMGQVGSPRDHWWGFLMILFFVIYFSFLLQGKHLDRMLLGEEQALNLGTQTKTVKLKVILTVCALTAFSVSIAGLIGFIGLVAPHISYLLLRSRRHKWTLTLAPLVGASLFLVSDITVRILSKEVEFPSGGVMSLIGAPALIYLLYHRGRRA